MLQFVFGIRIVQGTMVKWEGNGKSGLIVEKGAKRTKEGRRKRGEAKRTREGRRKRGFLIESGSFSSFSPLNSKPNYSTGLS